MTTTAQRIADLFDNDGQRYELEDGRELEDVCAEHGAALIAKEGGPVRFLFDDGSAIIGNQGFWDIALSEHCDCWKGAGHHHECRVGSTVELALDARHDLTEAYKCACDACCDAFAEIFESAADDIGEERGFTIRLVRCDYGSPEANETDQGEDINEIWQECHNRTPWGADECPDDCETRKGAEPPYSDGDVCSACGEPIEWHMILTRPAGSGDHVYGSCECGSSVWHQEERGGRWGKACFIGSEGKQS